jgi:flagellar protein FlaG
MNSNILNTLATSRRTTPAPQGTDSKVVNLENRIGANVAKPVQVQETKETQEVDQNGFKERLENSVSRLNDLADSVQRDLQFTIDDDSGETVITVLDTKTAEIIRQIPSKEVLALAQNIESLKGALFSAEV